MPIVNYSRTISPKTLARCFKLSADGIAASMLVIMSLVFILQIATRYLSAAIGVSLDLGWTLELLLTLWVWLVFWASAFCLNHNQHIRFDSIYIAMPKKAQRFVAAIMAVIMAVILAYSFLPTLDYILFYKIKKSPVMRIRMDYVFSIYGLFLLALIVRYSWRAIAHVVPSLYQRYYK